MRFLGSLSVAIGAAGVSVAAAASVVACHAVAGVEERTPVPPSEEGGVEGVDGAAPVPAEGVMPGTIETFAEGIWAAEIAIDDRWIFVADVKRGALDSRVLRFDKKLPGSKPLVFLSRDQIENMDLWDFVATKSQVFWFASSGTAVFRRNKDQTGRTEAVPLLSRAFELRQSSGELVAISVSHTPEGGPVMTDLEIWSEPQQTSFKVPEHGIGSAAFAGEEVYYFVHEGNGIAHWHLGDTAPTRIGTFEGETPYRPAIVEGTLYFTNVAFFGSSPTTLWRIPLAGGRPEPTLTDPDQLSLTADGPYLYLVSLGRYQQNVLRGGKVLRCEAARCKETLTTIVSDVTQLSHVAADTEWIYWTESGTGTSTPGRIRRYKK